MAKELYLYTGIYDFTAEKLISAIEDNKTEDIVIRVNSPGGSVFSGWGIVAKMREHNGHVKVKVDGVAASMSGYLPVFANEVEALDVSRILIHRADGYVRTPEDQEFLDGVNKDLKAKMSVKIDSSKLKELKGVTVDDIFNSEEVLNVWLTGKEAKAIGLVDRIVKLQPAEITAINDRMMISASSESSQEDPEPKPIQQNPKIQKPINKVMTFDEFKTQHPALYAQALAEGKTSGSTEERDRVRGWEAFRHIDATAVDKGIKEGKMITATDIAEFTAKALSPEYLKKLTASNAAEVTTAEEDGKVKTEKEKTITSFMAEVNANLGRKTEVK